jgi:hypothetical protein
MCKYSTWCLVAAKTTVCCSLSMWLFKRTNNAATLSSGLTVTYHNCNSSGIFDSTSNLNRTVHNSSPDTNCRFHLSRTGSLSPALANSTRTFGNVAENKTVCLASGSLATISVSCSPNPISYKRSASSNTTYSMLLNLSSISMQTCRKRPGVATITSGLP